MRNWAKLMHRVLGTGRAEATRKGEGRDRKAGVVSAVVGFEALKQVPGGGKGSEEVKKRHVFVVACGTRKEGRLGVAV